MADPFFSLFTVDLLTYIHTRSVRQESFQASTSERELDRESPEYRKELRSYLGRERVLLRKRRTKLKVDQFRIIAQVRLARSIQVPRKLIFHHLARCRSAKEGTVRSTLPGRQTPARSAR